MFDDCSFPYYLSGVVIKQLASLDAKVRVSIVVSGAPQNRNLGQLFICSDRNKNLLPCFSFIYLTLLS